MKRFHDLQTITKKYLICIPLMLLAMAGFVFTAKGSGNFFLYALCVVVFGVCMVVLQSERHIWAPREGVKYYADVNPSVDEENPNEEKPEE